MTSTLLCEPCWSDFSRIAHVYGEQAAVSQVKVANYGDFDFGAGLSKTEGFCSEKYSDRYRFISMQSVCAKTKSSWTIAVEHHSAQKLNFFKHETHNKTLL